MEQALRYNQGKIRMELVPHELIEGVAKVLSYGANKYTVKDEQGNVITDGSNNWRKGMKWMDVVASLERHLNAFKKGEDTDSESGLYHLEHAATNIAFLLTYYKSHPELDNRTHNYFFQKRIGLDIDCVLADWISHWCNHFQLDIPETWNFDRDIKSKFEQLQDNKDFWLSIPVKIKPKDIPFEPTCYITARGIPNEWTEKWLDMNKYPVAPVFTLGIGQSKVDIAKEQKLDWFVDDSFKNFVELNKAGIYTYLMDAQHNQRYNVGSKRIYSLQELVK